MAPTGLIFISFMIGNRCVLVRIFVPGHSGGNAPFWRYQMKLIFNKLNYSLLQHCIVVLYMRIYYSIVLTYLLFGIRFVKHRRGAKQII